MSTFNSLRLLHFMPFLLLTWVVSACASLLVPDVYSVTLSQMQSKIEGKFPLEKTFLNNNATLKLTKPVLEMLPQQERVAAQFAFRASLLGSKAIEGTLRMRSALHYEKSDHSLRLKSVALDSLSSNLAAPNWVQNGLQLAAEQILKTSFENYSVYQLKPAQIATVKNLGLSIGQPQIQAQGIDIRLLKN